MASRLRHPLVTVAGATALTLPWLVLWATGSVESLSTGATVGVSGLAVLGAAFLLAWGAETAEKDVPRAFAIAVLAVLAVAPEYAVDAFYAWQAGMNPGPSEAANLAIANMTGANRILIGLGWSGIALFTIYYAGEAGESVERSDGYLADGVILDRSIATEIAFLLGATAFAFAVPLFGGIDALDFVVLVGLYVAYVAIIVRGGDEGEEEHVGVPAYLQAFARRYRVSVVLALFAYSGAMILVAVEPFAHGLEQLGVAFGVPKFFMIQWIAPMASEAPELVIVAYLVNKARATASFNALISSKLNQWTLLVGTLVVVYSIAKGSYGTLPFDSKQTAEIWLTAAQSFFAIAALADFKLDVRESLALLVLFLAQVIGEYFVIRGVLPVESIPLLLAFTAVYIVLGIGLFVVRRDHLQEIISLATMAARGKQPETSRAD